MNISEAKMRIVIDNYFKTECSVDTTIREAFEKGFRLGVKKASCTQPEQKTGKWIRTGLYACGDYQFKCSECGMEEWRSSVSRFKYCPNCGARMEGEEHGT